MKRVSREALRRYSHHIVATTLTWANFGLIAWAIKAVWQLPCRESGINLVISRPGCPSLLADLAPLIVASGFWIAGLAVWLAGQYNWVFLPFVLGAGALATGKLSSRGGDLEGRLFYLLLTWLAPLIFQFHLTLLEHPPRRVGRAVQGILYTLAIVWSPPFLIWRISFLQQQDWFDALRLGVRLTLALAVVLVAILLWWNYRRSRSSAMRRRIRLIPFGSALAFAPLFLLSLLPDTLGAASHAPYEWTFPWLLLVPLFYVYSIFRHRLRGADAALKRAAVYYLLLILLLSIYLAAFAGLTRLAADLTINWQLMGIGALVTVGVLLLLAPLRQAIERLTNWVWYGNEAPYAGLLERLAESLSLTLDRETLRHLLVDELASAMHLSKSALLLRDQDDSLTLLKAIGFDFSEDSVLHLSPGGHLATYLETVAEPVIADKVRQALKGSALPADEQAMLSRTDVAFWLPLVSAGTLQGLLLIGFRQNGDVFTTEEERILATLARQSGVAAHNVRLMEQVHAGRRELARAHQQLLVGREQELRRLAHNLHDSVVQQLIGISYQLAESRRRAGNGCDIDAQESQELGADLETIRRGLLDVVKQLRGLVSELRPAGLEELGLTTALEGYVARLRREMGPEMPNILLDLNGSGDILPDPVAICLFRVAQEALRNALQHAGAENIALGLDLLADEAALSVQDDGCGFHVPARLSQLTQTDHFGLVGMAERVSWAGGRLAIRSQPGEGTAITVRIPLNGGEVDNE